MTTPVEKMAPCPFCGSAPECFNDIPYPHTRVVACSNDDCLMSETKTTPERWNTRAPIPSSAVVLPREVVEKIAHEVSALLERASDNSYMTAFQVRVRANRIAALLPPTGAGVGE